MTSSSLLFAAGAVGAALLCAQTTRTVWDGVYTEEQSKRGGEVYSKECAGCHGAQLTGGESAPPLTGDGFLSNWTGQTAGVLFDRIRQTMPQQDPGRLSRQQNADVLAFLFHANGYPAGKVELDKQTEALNLIKITPK